MAITKLNFNGTVYSFANQATEDIQLYQGRELSEYSWEQIKEKVKNADYLDLRIGDYKIFTLTTGEKMKVQIAGIDTYYNSNYGIIIGHHIDFISKNVIPNSMMAWTNQNYNNGTAIEPCPYIASKIRDYLLNTIFPTLPTDLQNVINDKWTEIESRYSASGELIHSNGRPIKNLGKLWLPSEFEVFGTTIFGTKGFSAHSQVQYPLFLSSSLHRLIDSKYNSDAPTGWWLSTVSDGNSTHICCVDGDGQVIKWLAAGAVWSAPLCFRIGEKEN